MSVPPPPPMRPPRYKGIREVKDGIDKHFPLGVGIDWPNTPKEGRLFNKMVYWRDKERSFHWYEFGIGISVTSLFWGVMFKMFGGSQ